MDNKKISEEVLVKSGRIGLLKPEIYHWGFAWWHPETPVMPGGSSTSSDQICNSFCKYVDVNGI